MDIRKISAVAALSLAFCMICTSCGDKDKKEKKSTEYKNENISENETKVPAEEPDKTYETDDGETAYAVTSGQAYLEIRDARGIHQYLGGTEEDLCYNAGVADIKENGSYTVSVTADSAGFRKKAGEGEKPEGLMYAALKIKDGAKECPNAVLTIDSIEVDGKDLPLEAKNYTFVEMETDIKSNIYNEWASMIPAGAVSAEGAVAEDNTDYSNVIIPKDAFTSWTEVKVNFTVSGM